MPSTIDNTQRPIPLHINARGLMMSLPKKCSAVQYIGADPAASPLAPRRIFEPRKHSLPGRDEVAGRDDRSGIARRAGRSENAVPVDRAGESEPIVERL